MQLYHEHLLHLPRKQCTATKLLLFLLIILFLVTALPIPILSSQLATPFFTYSTNPELPRTPLRDIHLESPIFQPQRIIRNVRSQEDDPLSQQLIRIRDVQNWRLLGDIQNTGKAIYTQHAPYLFNEANIAFFLQLSNTNINLAPRLLSRIWHPNNIYCIHFDAKIPSSKTDIFIAAIKSNFKLSNVILLPSVPVTYDGISDLLNTLDSIHSLLTVSQKWDYFINLSGSDYPLVSATGIRRLLGMPEVLHSSRSFVHFSPNQTTWTDAMRGRLGRIAFDLSLGFDHKSDEELFYPKTPNPIVIANKVAIEIPKGAAWIIGHRTFCEYAAHSNAARRLIALFSIMKTSSEHFFQTLAWNHHELNETTVRNAFRHVLFAFNGVSSGQHPYFLDRQSSNGKWDMWPSLAHSPNFFARKFQIPDSKLLDHIDTQKSGATVRVANMSAVTESFRLVKKQFLCMIDVHSGISREQIAPCQWKGRRETDCNRNPGKPCAGDFAEPPA